jgi:periplasmic protein TonB
MIFPAEGPHGGAAPVVRIGTTDEPAKPAWAGADLTNVVLFKRHRHEDETAATVGLAPGERPAPTSLRPDPRAWMFALFLGSFTAHAGVYWMLNREPPPLASIGVESMSVEIVLGTDLPAGHAADAVKSEQEPAQLPIRATEPAAQPEPQQQALQQVESEPPPEEAPLVVSTHEPPPVVAPPAPPAPPVLAVPSASETVAPRPAPAKRVDTAPAHPPKPQHPVRQHQAMLPTAVGAPAPSANGVGRGRSDADSNYRGLVAAHLARYKRFPADARSRGDQGVASVSFSLDGGGRVTSVGLMRGSGVASLDQEVQAMVHRASPFPAPPSGRPMSFTVPVSFRLQ